MLGCMRATLNLDDDVASLLERIRRARPDESMRELINTALRTGLEQLERKPRRKNRYASRTVSLGRCRFSNVDNVAAVLSLVESGRAR